MPLAEAEEASPEVPCPGPHRSPLEDAQFSCASWKRVRIFEGIVGVFQDAHFSKSRAHLRNGVRTFESRASALGYPLAGALPFARKVVQALASASIALFSTGPPACLVFWSFTFHHFLRHPEGKGDSLFPCYRRTSRAARPQIKRAVPGSLIRARLRVCEIYSSWLYRISLFVSRILHDSRELFHSKRFLALFRRARRSLRNGKRTSQSSGGPTARSIAALSTCVRFERCPC